MPSRFACALLTAGLLAGPLTVGCNRTISEQETVTRKRDGTVIRDRESVKERPDGTVVVEKDLDVDRD